VRFIILSSERERVKRGQKEKGAGQCNTALCGVSFFAEKRAVMVTVHFPELRGYRWAKYL
jgi:hypothetical protein